MCSFFIWDCLRWFKMTVPIGSGTLKVWCELWIYTDLVWFSDVPILHGFRAIPMPLLADAGGNGPWRSSNGQAWHQDFLGSTWTKVQRDLFMLPGDLGFPPKKGFQDLVKSWSNRDQIVNCRIFPCQICQIIKGPNSPGIPRRPGDASIAAPFTTKDRMGQDYAPW